jgi:hypothetical protein
MLLATADTISISGERVRATKIRVTVKEVILIRLTSMQEEVILEIRLFAKSSRTNVTFEGPRSAVHIHMRTKITGRWE